MNFQHKIIKKEDNIIYVEFAQPEIGPEYHVWTLKEEKEIKALLDSVDFENEEIEEKKAKSSFQEKVTLTKDFLIYTYRTTTILQKLSFMMYFISLMILTVFAIFAFM